MLSPLNTSDLPRLERCRGVVAFLDSARPTAQARHSYLFLSPVSTITASSYGEVVPALEAVDRASRDHWVCGYVAYEAGYALEERLAPLRTLHEAGELPILWFGVFAEPYRYDHATSTWDRPLPAWCASRGRDLVSDTVRLRHSVGREAYARSIGRIKRWIGRGDTYQVNYTYDVDVRSGLSPFALYRHLRRSQATPHCAFIQTPYGHVASFSPELFFRKRRDSIAVKPMKGTAPRGRFPREDQTASEELSRDVKNRAENLMIVDMMRNDLGRICLTGTVETPRLFDVETHPTLHQMTSTVTGALRRGTSLTEVFGALFPSGSVTGAPKIRTVELIGRLEAGPRGVYCGAIGYAGPGGRAEFNVPIRTLQRASGSVRWRYRVGSGIVWDSRAGAEWEECRTKCGFLTHSPPAFELLETILHRRGFLYLAQHLDRMRVSAKQLGFAWGRRRVEGAIAEARRSLSGAGSHRVRILLGRDGAVRWESSPIAGDARGSVRVAMARAAIDERESLLYHKTTHRPWYAGDMERIRTGRCFDVIHTNRKGQLTEGARSNLFVRIGDDLFTPPVECGLLAGVLRRRLIECGKCRERVLYARDLRRAGAVYCGNSVRGLVEVDVAS